LLIVFRAKNKSVKIIVAKQHQFVIGANFLFKFWFVKGITHKMLNL